MTLGNRFASLLLGDVERSVHFADMPELWVVVLVVIPAVILVISTLYRREKGNLDSLSRGALAAIRVALVFLVLFVLFQPVVETTVYQVRKPTLAVLIDESASMQRGDRYADPATRKEIRRLADLGGDDEVYDATRLDLVKSILSRDEGALLDELAGENDLAMFAFGSEVRSVEREDLGSLRANGESTALGDAVHSVLRRLRGQPVSAIVVLSDGRRNTGRSVEDAALESQNRPAPVPVYTIGIGDPDEPRDVGIEDVDSPDVALVNDEIIFEVTVRSKGFEGQRIDVILEEDERRLTVESLILEGENREQNVLLYYRPTEPGVHRYTVSIPVLEDEEYDENNRVERTVNVIRRHINVLFVDGYPRWEYRYLKEAMRRDEENLEMTCLLLSADPDFVQETSRGVPPLVRFPRTREELFEYDVILFGDVDPQDLAGNPTDVENILENIRQFVEEGSGGFGLISGEVDSPRSFKNTPIEKILPVVISDGTEDPMRFRLDSSRSQNLRLTDLGQASPIMILEQDPEENRLRWEDEDRGLPGFFWYAPVKKAKPGAQVLAVHPEHSNKYGAMPLVATQFYGSGRTYFSALDSSWRWRFLHGDLYFYRYWGQVLRFLAKGRLSQFNPRFEIYADKERYGLGEMVILTAKVRDANFEPSRVPTQEVVLQVPGSATPVRLTLDLDPTRPGTYTQTLSADEVGTYRVRTPDESSNDAQGRTVSFEVTIPSVEKENVSLDAGTLAILARRTDGEYLPLSDIEELGSKIVPLPEKVAGNRTREDLWDREWNLGGIPVNWVILVFAGLIVTEWLIRKRKRLL